MYATSHIRRLTRRSLAPAALAVALSSLAAAGEPTPGSLLFFPEYDNASPGVAFLVTLTNVNPTEQVLTEWDYVDGVGCFEFNRFELLTPTDTLTVVTSFHNPEQDAGYLFVSAVDGDLQPIVFDWLVGTSTRIDGLAAFDYSVDPIAFHGVGNEGQQTDVDQDGVRDLDGLEYTQVADQLLVPRFLGQDPPAGIQSELVLASLTRGDDYTAIVSFLVYNDNGDVFSVEHAFDCWLKVPLLDVSAVFSQEFLAEFTNQDPEEVLGAPQLEAGWIRIDGQFAVSGTDVLEDPALLGFLIERSAAGGGAAELPFGVGLQANGGLKSF